MKTKSILVLTFVTTYLVGCSKALYKEQGDVASISNIGLVPSALEYSPSFVMRFRDVMDDEQKSLAWEIAIEESKRAKNGEALDRTARINHQRMRDHKLSITGHIFSPLRNADYIAGFVTYEDSPWIQNIGDYRAIYSSVYASRIEPAFRSISNEYGYLYQCVYGCEEGATNQVYKFRKKESEDTFASTGGLNTFYASVCMLYPKPVHKLNAALYDPEGIKKALYNKERDGLNIHLFVPAQPEEEIEAFERITSYNPNCKGPENSVDAFYHPVGRDLYRAISDQIPEYYATLAFENEYALYQGEIWKLQETSDAKLFHGVRTTN